MGDFNQLCIWEGTLLGDNTVEDFEEFFEDNGFRIKFADQYETLPDKDEDGFDVEDTGGRNDILFYIHDEDIMKFALWRFQYRIRWWGDFLDNGNDKIVPIGILEKYPYGW